jgi:hypothetical protein
MKMKHRQKKETTVILSLCLNLSPHFFTKSGNDFLVLLFT